MLIYQEFLAVNEDMAAYDPNERLRYCVHEIIFKMKPDESITFPNLSKALKEEWNIEIPTEILKAMFEAWDRFTNPDFTIFKKEDKNWMTAFPYQNYVKRKARDKQSFGKHRKKDIGTSSDGHWDGHKWVPGKTKTWNYTRGGYHSDFYD